MPGLPSCGLPRLPRYRSQCAFGSQPKSAASGSRIADAADPGCRSPSFKNVPGCLNAIHGAARGKRTDAEYDEEAILSMGISKASSTVGGVAERTRLLKPMRPARTGRQTPDHPVRPRIEQMPPTAVANLSRSARHARRKRSKRVSNA